MLKVVTNETNYPFIKHYYILGQRMKTKITMTNNVSLGRVFNLIDIH